MRTASQLSAIRRRCLCAISSLHSAQSLLNEVPRNWEISRLTFIFSVIRLQTVKPLIGIFQTGCVMSNQATPALLDKCIPMSSEPHWDNVWAPRLAGFLVINCLCRKDLNVGAVRGFVSNKHPAFRAGTRAIATRIFHPPEIFHVAVNLIVFESLIMEHPPTGLWIRARNRLKRPQLRTTEVLQDAVHVIHLVGSDILVRPRVRGVDRRDASGLPGDRLHPTIERPLHSRHPGESSRSSTFGDAPRPSSGSSLSLADHHTK